MESRAHSAPNGSDDRPLFADDLESRLESNHLRAQLEEDAQTGNSGWLASFTSGAKNLGHGIWNTAKAVGHAIITGAKHFKDHPVASTLGIITAAPVALFALTSPSGSSPSKIGKIWWFAMSKGKRAYSIACGGASFSINAIMNSRFLVLTPKKFTKTIKTTFDSPGDFAINSSAIVLTISSGFGAWMLSYNAFTWLPYGEALAAIPASLAALIMAFSRYPSIVAILKKPAHLFRNHFRFQRDFADKIDHINQKHLETVERELNNIIAELNNDYQNVDLRNNSEAYEELLRRLSKTLSDLAEAHPDFIRDTSTGEYAKYYASVVFDATVALSLFAAPTFITFSQKGFDAVNLATKFATGESLDNLTGFTKMLIGLPCGIASAMYYGNSGTGLRETMVSVVSELYNNPKKIPSYLVLYAMNGLGAGSMFNVARGIISKENIFSITNNAVGTTYRITQGLSGASVNTIITSREALLDKVSQDDQILNLKLISADLRYQDEQVVSNESIEQIQQFSLWSGNAQQEENNTPVHVIVDDEQNSGKIVVSAL